MQKRRLGKGGLSVSTIRRAQTVHPIAALQTEYSLWIRVPEDEILPTCRALGIGFVAYSPLGRGFLSGKIKRFEDSGGESIKRVFRGPGGRRDNGFSSNQDQDAGY